MTVSIHASHYSGCGNDFLLFDNRTLQLPTFTADLIQRLCDQRKGAGVDGIIFVMPSTRGDVGMKFFNSDGSEADMCGNGVRCLMQYLRQKLAYPRTRCLLETKKRDILLSTDDTTISVQMGQMIEKSWDMLFTFCKKEYTMHLIDSGVPHLVTIVDEAIDSLQVEKIGRHFRRHPRFQPEGANVNFVAIDRSKETPVFHIRTYERGVEAETQACGTGVTAAAYALYKKLGYLSPFCFQVRSKELLSVIIEKHNQAPLNCYLVGQAKWIRDYVITLQSEQDMQHKLCSMYDA